MFLAGTPSAVLSRALRVAPHLIACPFDKMQALASLNKKSHKAAGRAGDGAAGKVSVASAAVVQQRPLVLQPNDLKDWTALLCTLISDRELKALRHDGKRLLRRLCGSQVTAGFGCFVRVFFFFF